jgi:hypothetical protein
MFCRAVQCISPLVARNECFVGCELKSEKCRGEMESVVEGGQGWCYAAARGNTLSSLALRIFHPLICFVCIFLPIPCLIYKGERVDDEWGWNYKHIVAVKGSFRTFTSKIQKKKKTRKGEIQERQNLKYLN